ncbi:DUF5123 domain-containing protein [Sphingobacterium sp. DR205]|uniref:DUF5123 domain-containing protein n=1 Tax=Sphingobacterium sp. DR205 TaxID=2713573 RepID=UPI0013E48C90|nr:DUF5123 domain-containing protein [Sphingobacterium sp. DR205]QIH32679.1 DUF5123 domain-containing protein [Sphingobacterium sp. DR205]
MKKIILNIIMPLALVLNLFSCKKANDWEVDASHQRLFKSLKFATSIVGATSVEIAYTQTVAAQKYIFEFSKDSLQFAEIVKTVEILADTLTPFAPSTIPARVEYRTLFDDLEGLTGYSVRMKGLNTETGDESNYLQLYFKTAAEQLFNKWTLGVTEIELYWPATDRVTHVSVFDAEKNTELQKIPLSAANKAEGHIKIEGLQAGTNYRVAIFNEQNERGAKLLKTLGLAGGEMITVNPGDDIPTLVSSAIARGKTNIVLVFAGGKTYDLANVVIPAGISNLNLTGIPDANGNKPKLNLMGLQFTDLILGEVLFENLSIHANGSPFLISQDKNGASVIAYTFKNCYIERFGSGVVRLNNAVTVAGINFDNCVVDKIGGYGVVNIGGSTASVDSISITNSTFTDLTTQLMDVRVAVGKIVVGNCTFYNQNSAMSQLLRFDTARLPLAFVGSNNIISGMNGGGRLNATSYDHASFGLKISFAGSYRTNELQIERASRDFSEITVFSGSADDLFVDPTNKDFRIKAGNGFGGRGTAGDPRWFE